MAAADLSGVYTYRSFRDIDDPSAGVESLLFGQGELTLFVRADGTLSGTLAFPADANAAHKVFMDLTGSVSSWSPLTIAFSGKGRETTGIADFEYAYKLELNDRWPDATAQKTTLVGSVIRSKDHGQPPSVAKAGVTASVIAVKRDFVEPKDVHGGAILPEALTMLASKEHRLQHAVWHTLRAVWWDPALSDQNRTDIAAKGWDVKRPPRTKQGSLDLANGAGEDFLYMHREMIGMVRKHYEAAGKPMIRAWNELPGPATPQVVYTEVPDPEDPALIVFRRDEEASGVAVPVAASDSERWIKSPEYFSAVMRPLSLVFRQPRMLASLSLGALGNLLEMTIHNAMHMRWASVARNPVTGEPQSRGDFDFGDEWNDPRYDYLGEFYSSHVNPVFWRLHGWVDDRIEDWFAAQEIAEPGRVTRESVGGVDWFAVNDPWVKVAKPFAGTGDTSAGTHGHGHGHGHHGDGLQAMLDVMDILKQVFEPPTPGPALLAHAAPRRRLMAFSTWVSADAPGILHAGEG